MKPSFLSELFLYRHRYVVGYFLLALITVALLTIRLGDVPPGLTPSEQASAVHSFNLQFNPQIPMLDLPYHLLQKGTLYLFGPTELGVRLPSILVGFALAAGIFFLFRRWFARNVAIMGGVVVVSSTHFLMRGRTGTALIMISFWAIYIILFATLITQESKFKSLFKILLIGTLGLSLYTPYMLFLTAAMAITVLIHPHLRYVLRGADKAGLFIAGMLVLFILSPLGWYIYNHPEVIRDLIGIPATLPSLSTYAQQIGEIFTMVGGIAKSTLGGAIIPLFGIPAIALAVLGLARTVMDYHSTRSHLLLIWLALLLPMVALHPTTLAVLFVPLICLIAIGLNALIRMWYGLFPRNPYARIFALAPIAILLLVILQFNYNRYFIGLPYSPAATAAYNSDSQLLQHTIAEKKLQDKPLTLVVEPQEKAFYNIPSPQLKKHSAIDSTVLNPTQPTSLIISETTYDKLLPAQQAALGQPTHLIVNSLKDNALRFRLFIR